jgi:hypothetical protein
LEGDFGIGRSVLEGDFGIGRGIGLTAASSLSGGGAVRCTPTALMTAFWCTPSSPLATAESLGNFMSACTGASLAFGALGGTSLAHDGALGGTSLAHDGALGGISACTAASCTATSITPLHSSVCVLSVCVLASATVRVAAVAVVARGVTTGGHGSGQCGAISA